MPKAHREKKLKMSGLYTACSQMLQTQSQPVLKGSPTTLTEECSQESPSLGSDDRPVKISSVNTSWDQGSEDNDNP